MSKLSIEKRQKSKIFSEVTLSLFDLAEWFSHATCSLRDGLALYESWGQKKKSAYKSDSK